MKSRYQYLLRTSRTPSEVAEFLYPVSGMGPADDPGNIFRLCKDEMHKLIYASLDFIRFKNEDGEFHNVIPEELKIDIKERVENEYQAFIDGLDVERMVNDAESAVLARVEDRHHPFRRRMQKKHHWDMALPFGMADDSPGRGTCFQTSSDLNSHSA